MQKRILVVDDESTISELISTYFSRNGFVVQTASNYKEALRLIESENFDLVISDIALAENDGLELLGVIKSARPKLPVIMMTGMGYDEELVEEARRKGADGYVSKKLPLSQLMMEVLRITRFREQAGASK